jgi:uncharacterized protein (DUF342 family)
MKWIGKGDSLRLDGKIYGYGDDLPVEKISAKMMEQLTAQGKIGVIPEKYDPEKHLEAKVSTLEAANEELKKELKKLKKALKKAREVKEEK